MNVKPITLVVVGKDDAATVAWFQRQDSLATREYAHVVLVQNQPPCSLSEMGNRYLNQYMEVYRSQVFAMIHADTYFDGWARCDHHGLPVDDAVKPDLQILYECAMRGNVCGIVGADMSPQRWWWGHQVRRTTARVAIRLVSTLDSCAVFFRRDLGLRFDETFAGFHCHVEDLCLQAHQRGIPVLVPAVRATHVGESTGKPEWQAEYARWRKVLAEKWEGTEFVTT